MALARSWSLCVILSDHRIIVPHLNDGWFFFHKLYHPKLLWFVHMNQWYCEILILAYFASDGIFFILRVTAYDRSWSLCVILSDHCIIVPHLNDKWFFFHKLYHPKLLWFIHMVQWYCEILIWFILRVTVYARSWSLCVILSDHRIIVPHLNDKWFFFHKLYHPKLLCVINIYT